MGSISLSSAMTLSLAPRYGGGTPAPTPAPGVAATTFATAPAVQYHPHAQAGTVTKSGSVITACPDLQGLAALSAVAGTGPVEMTDALGRKFWRFEGTKFAQIAAAYAANTRACSIVFVGRNHRAPGAADHNILSLGLNGSAPPATTTGPLCVSGAGSAVSRAPVPRPQGFLAATDATNKKNVVVGSQMQVLAVAARTTANGGQRVYVNNNAASVAQSSTSAATAGAELGRMASSGSGFGMFDLYEIALWADEPSNAVMDARVAAAVTNWSIPAITGTLILDGDSRFSGHTTVSMGQTVGMVLTDPGAELVSTSLRVINIAVSGAQVPNLVARRDETNGIYASDMQLASGVKRVVFMIGVNDVGASGNANYPTFASGTTGRGDDVYAAVVALIYNGTTGYLDRGFEVVSCVEMASSNAALMVSTGQKRTRERAAAFLTDCLAGSGELYDGKLSRLEFPLATIGGTTLFDTTVNAANTTYYNADGIHPNNTGAAAMVTGGDTPQYGLGSLA